MTHLIKTEWLKIKKYRAFWWIIGITALTYPGINYIFYNVYNDIITNNDTGEIARLLMGNPFSFPENFHTVAYFSSWFVFIPAIIVIMLITNEYSYKTHRQNIIDGWSRSEFMTSKLFDVLIVALLITLLYFLVSLMAGFFNRVNGVDFGQVYYASLFFLQTFSQLTIAFFFGYLLKRALFALAAFLFYFIVLENVLVAILKAYAHDEGRFLPLETSDRLIPVPAFLGKINEGAYYESLASINYHVVYTFILTGIIWTICYRVNSKRDL